VGAEIKTISVGTLDQRLNLSPMKIDRALRNTREFVGENQTEFAKRFGVRQPVLSRWETGRATPSVPVRMLIRRVLEEVWEGKSD